MAIDFMTYLRLEALADYRHDVAAGRESRPFEVYYREWLECRHQTEMMDNAPPPGVERVTNPNDRRLTMQRANQPAFPTPTPVAAEGLTIREHFAGLALQGLLTNYNSPSVVELHRLADLAVRAADALLYNLNPPPPAGEDWDNDDEVTVLQTHDEGGEGGGA